MFYKIIMHPKNGGNFISRRKQQEALERFFGRYRK